MQYTPLRENTPLWKNTLTILWEHNNYHASRIMHTLLKGCTLLFGNMSRNVVTQIGMTNPRYLVAFINGGIMFFLFVIRIMLTTIFIHIYPHGHPPTVLYFPPHHDHSLPPI